MLARGLSRPLHKHVMLWFVSRLEIHAQAGQRLNIHGCECNHAGEQQPDPAVPDQRAGRHATATVGSALGMGIIRGRCADV